MRRDFFTPENIISPLQGQSAVLLTLLEKREKQASFVPDACTDVPWGAKNNTCAAAVACVQLYTERFPNRCRHSEFVKVLHKPVWTWS